MDGNQILYFLGAGASVPTIPIVNDLSSGLIVFSERLKAFGNTIITQYTTSNLHQVETLLNELYEDTIWLSNLCESHMSVDTVAKKLITKGEDKNLNKLKRVLAYYFSYLQFTSRVNSRYDAFIAGIFNHKKQSFPENLKIISWNYDIEFELAFSDYFSNENYDQICTKINLLPSTIITPRLQDFFLYKINGSATFKDRLYKSSAPLFPYVKTSIPEQEVMRQIVSFLSERYSNQITFAFEKEDNDPNLTSLQESIRLCETLVIVGYSFPYFNRTTDKMILGNLNLKNVYIQTLENSYASVKDSFKAVAPLVKENSIFHINADSKIPFYIPPQL